MRKQQQVLEPQPAPGRLTCRRRLRNRNAGKGKLPRLLANDQVDKDRQTGQDESGEEVPVDKRHARALAAGPEGPRPAGAAAASVMIPRLSRLTRLLLFFGVRRLDAALDFSLDWTPPYKKTSRAALKTAALQRCCGTLSARLGKREERSACEFAAGQPPRRGPCRDPRNGACRGDLRHRHYQAEDEHRDDGGGERG